MVHSLTMIGSLLLLACMRTSAQGILEDEGPRFSVQSLGGHAGDNGGKEDYSVGLGGVGSPTCLGEEPCPHQGHRTLTDEHSGEAGSDSESDLDPEQRYSDQPLTGRFLHITDFHLDFHYKPSSLVSSHCRLSPPRGGTDVPPKKLSGVLGTPQSRKCDSPQILVDLTREFVDTLNPDFVLWTGDSAPHHIGRDREQVLESMAYVTHALYRYHPKLVPVLGNNDLVPHNKVTRNDSILSDILRVWEPIVPKLHHDVFKRLGCYSKALVTGVLRAISVNTMFWTKSNRKHSHCKSSSSPAREQLRWLDEELRKAQKADERVILVGHVPPTPSNWQRGCLEAYVEVVFRYRPQISGQFFGHTNYDSVIFLSPMFKHRRRSSSTLTFGPDSAVAASKFVKDIWWSYDNLLSYPWKSAADMEENVLVAHVAPSVIPVFEPAVRLWTYDTATGRMLDYDQYYVNLESLNKIVSDGKTPGVTYIGARGDQDPPFQRSQRKLSSYFEHEYNLRGFLDSITAFPSPNQGSTASTTFSVAPLKPLTVSDYSNLFRCILSKHHQHCLEAYLKNMVVGTSTKHLKRMLRMKQAGA